MAKCTTGAMRCPCLLKRYFRGDIQVLDFERASELVCFSDEPTICMLLCGVFFSILNLPTGNNQNASQNTRGGVVSN